VKEETWFTEELGPSDADFDRMVKSPDDANEPVPPPRGATAVLRADRPRWERVAEEDHKFIRSPNVDHFLLVRLGFQFSLTREADAAGSRIISARCSAFLWPARPEEPTPTVYDLLPRDLYNGKPGEVTLKLSPSLNLGPVSGSIGEIGTSVRVGTVEPVVVGFPGRDEREPYWDLRPQRERLVGVRHFWLVVEVPVGCDGAWIATRVQAELQTRRLRVLPVGPKHLEWEDRPHILMQA
jgi:hypothetical protein